MKKVVFILLFALTAGSFVQAQILPNLGGQRTGASTLTYLKNDASPRAWGMASANITLRGDGYTAFTNPAAMSTVVGLNFSTSNYFMGTGVNQTFFSTILPMSKSSSAFGLTVNNLSSGKQEVRTEFRPQGTGEYFYVNNTAIGLAYSKELSDQFSFGLKFKYIHESLAQYRNHAVAADLGFLYKTDVKDLSFVVLVKNFGGNSSLSGSHREVNFNQKTASPDKYQVPTEFMLGASVIPYKKDNHQIMVAMQLNHPNDNSENLRFGVEYGYRKLLFLRTGIKLGVKGQRYPTFGVGYRTRLSNYPLNVNYAMIPTNFMGLQHSIGLSFTLLKAENRESNEAN